MAGFALSASGLRAYMAVRGVGVVAGTRTTTGVTAFGSFTTNSATSPSSNALQDVLLDAGERVLYVLTDNALSTVDLSQSPSDAAWAGAPLNLVASSTGGARFAGLALSM